MLETALELFGSIYEMRTYRKQTRVVLEHRHFMTEEVLSDSDNGYDQKGHLEKFYSFSKSVFLLTEALVCMYIFSQSFVKRKYGLIEQV